jgi:hypothetical protein
MLSSAVSRISYAQICDAYREQFEAQRRCLRGKSPAMKDHSGMGEIWQMRGLGLRESLLMALAIYGLTRGCDSFADDMAPKFAVPRQQFAVPLLAHSFLEPSFAAAPILAEPDAFSLNEFRPRKRGFLEFNGPRSESRLTDMPRLQDNSVARQMAEFKSQDRLRLLTLWQSHASSLSIQAGKKGAPSLQWSTPLMRRESSPRGLFDHLLSVSPQGAFGGARNPAQRPATVIGSSKAPDLGAAVKQP